MSAVVSKTWAQQRIAYGLRKGLLKFNAPVEVTLEFERRVKREERERRAAGK
jgi:hypothetical protein